MTSSTDPFHSPRYSIEHAKRRVAEFEWEVAAFFKTDPYARVTEQNTDGTEDLHKIKLIKPMPVGLPGIAFDAFNSLRSALDQAAYAVGIAAKTNGKNSHFPFGDSLTNVQGQAKGWSKDLPKEIFNLMVSFKPYKGGNDLLWALNELCNSHKHEIIIPLAMATGGGSITNANPSEVISLSFPPRWDRVKNEMIVAHLRHGAAYNMDIDIETFIALANIDVVDGQPAVAILNKLIAITDSIIVAIEAESHRLGLFH